MTDKLKAQVSAFVDDELLDAESELLVRRLCSDNELRHTAARYTLIGDAIRGSLHEIRADLAGNIMQVIENEPLAQPQSTVARRGLPKVLGGGLLAATVAAVAVFSLRPGPAPGNDANQIMAGQEPAIVVPDDRADVAPFQPLASPVVSQAGNQSRLDRYLIRHNQFATTTTRQGVLTYRSMGAEGDTGAEAAPQTGEETAAERNKTDNVTP